MEIFIDTANIEEIKKYSRIGIIDGVTTNPALITQEGKDFKKVVYEICNIIDETNKYKIIHHICQYISYFHTLHEHEIELVFFTNELIRTVNSN